MELRQFVYLDDLAVQSLLASKGIAMPEEITETDESIREAGGGGSAKAGLEVPMVGKADLGVDMSGSKTGREMLQTQRRITNQFAFNRLHEELDNQVIDLTENTNFSPSPGDIIKIQAPIRTDAIFRVLKVLSLFSDIADIENQEEIQKAEEMLYEDAIGVSIEYENSRFSFASTLKPSNLWVDEERAFLGNKEYVVFGRVFDSFDGDQKWDYLDLAEIVDTIVADETMDDLRTVISAFIEKMGEAKGEFELPDPSQANVESFNDLENLTKQAASQSAFQLGIDEHEIAIQGPGIEIDPIAIYW